MFPAECGSACLLAVRKFGYRSVKGAIFAGAFLIGSAGSVDAQQNFHNQNRNSLGGLIGALVRAGAKEQAKKEWQALRPEKLECMSRGLSLHGNSVARLSEAGIGPDDGRLSEISAKCESLLTRELRSDFECTLEIAGQPAATRCNESFALGYGRTVRPIGREQYIFEGIRGNDVSVMQVETRQAMIERGEREAQQLAAEEENQRKKDAIAEAELKAQKASQDAAIAKQANIERTQLAKRDQDILALRGTCKAPAVADGLSQLLSNDHEARTALLDVSTAPVKAYQLTTAWLPKSPSKSSMLAALNDRIEYDAKRWGAVVAQSGHGDYSWENLKSALGILGASCLWAQYDELAVGAAKAMAPEAVDVALGRAQATTTGSRVGAIVLSKVPSARFFHSN